MTRLPMSKAAAAMLRALLARGGQQNRILLSQVRSTDWQSLTFTGERHQFQFHIPGSDSGLVHERLVAGLEDAEFAIPGQIVADVCAQPARRATDGSISVAIEALTIAE